MRYGGRTTRIWFALALLGSVFTATASAATPPRYEAQVVNPELSGGAQIQTAGGPVLLTWGSDATILRSDDGATWRHAQTPGAADLAQLASDAAGSVMVAVGSKGSLLRSTDAGRTWQSPHLPRLESDLLAVVNVGATNIWIAAGADGRILRSTDGGKHWAVVESKLQVTLRALSFDAKSGIVLMGGDGGLVGFSRDAGESWQVTVISMPDPVSPITGFHRFGNLLLARSALGRFLMSEDGAQSWDLMQSSSTAFFTGAAFDTEHDAIVLTGHTGDVLRSTDGGRNWLGAEVAVNGHKQFLSAIHFDARSKSLLVNGQSGMVARSTDGGATWQGTKSGLRGELRGFIADDKRGALHVFGSGGQIAASIDAGAHWRYAREPLDYSLREILAAPSGGLLATSRLGDVLRSTNAGETWDVVTPAYPDMNTPPDLRGLLIAPSGEAVIAVGPPGAILRAPADGKQWNVRVWTDIAAEVAYPWMLVDRQRKLLVAVETRGAMVASRDDGETWDPSPLPTLLPAGNLPYWQGVVKESNGLLIVAGESGKAARSIDGARTWKLIDSGTRENLYGSFVDETSGAVYLMGARGALLRSGDDGATWQSVNTGVDRELRRMVREPRSGALLCFGAHGTILRSQDQGRSWRLVPSGTDGVLRKSLLEPDSGQLLLVGSQGALLRSADGRRWEKLPTHTERHFNSIAADQATGGLVLAGERIVRLVRQSAR